MNERDDDMMFNIFLTWTYQKKKVFIFLILVVTTHDIKIQLKKPSIKIRNSSFA